MRAVVLHEYGGPEKLKFEENVPEPQISGNTVLIAATAASVNPIDWKLRSGMMQKIYPLPLPAILGRDVSGIVQAVGANVKHFETGDRVLALSNKTYAELVAVDDSEVTHLPDGVDLADAAAIPLIATRWPTSSSRSRSSSAISRRLSNWISIRYSPPRRMRSRPMCASSSTSTTSPARRRVQPRKSLPR